VACPPAGASSQYWWEIYPERLEAELRALDELGYPRSRDDDAFAAGILRLRVTVPLPERSLQLFATFPDSYPSFPFAVVAPGLDLEHHQHPIGKNLCLLPRSSTYWRPASDRLAYVLRDQLPKVLHAGETNDPAIAAPHEQHVPEPFSDYYSYQEDTLVLVAAGESGSERVPPDVRAGSVMLGIEGAKSTSDIGLPLRAALLEVRDERGRVVLRAPDRLAERYACRIEGRWARRAGPVRADSAMAVAQSVYRASGAADALGVHPKSYATRGNATIQVGAVLFPEEHRWRGAADAVGDGWAFAVRCRPTALGGPSSNHQNRARRGAASVVVAAGVDFLARPGRYAPGDLAVRVPELGPLRHHTIGVFGLGCIGAPSALEFARAGIGGLRLLDHDTVDPATTTRWPFGLPFAGRRKAEALRHLIVANYPYVRVTSHVHQIGLAREVPADGSEPAPSEQAVLTEALSGCTLLYDATAEYGVQQFLANLARDRGLPYLGVQATPGGWGGLVARILPGETEGCWSCLQHWRNEPTERGAFATLLSDESHGDVHPPGCADATYTGANFDLGEVALQGVRAAVEVLTGDVRRGDAERTWDVAALALRDPSGARILPQWTSRRLPRHPACTACTRRP